MRRGIRLRGIKTVTKPNGKRFVYRRVNGTLVPLPNLPRDSQEFLAAYVEAGKVTPNRSKAAQGSIAALCEAYLASSAFNLYKDSSKRAKRAIIDRIKTEVGQAKLSDLQTRHIRKDVAKLTHGASENRLKAWRSLLGYAISHGMIEIDPSRGVKKVKGKVTSHHQWTWGEIDQYREFWPIGSPQRTAMEVLYWTGARCIDSVTFGHQMVKDGWLSFTQEKTQGIAVVPITVVPNWCAAIKHDHEYFLGSIKSQKTQWIVISTGKPRSVKGLSNYIKESALKAGLPNICTAHGLRSARAAKLSEIGATPHQIGAWTGHKSLSEIVHYTQGADQKNILLGGAKLVKIGNRL